MKKNRILSVGLLALCLFGCAACALPGTENMNEESQRISTGNETQQTPEGQCPKDGETECPNGDCPNGNCPNGAESDPEKRETEVPQQKVKHPRVRRRKPSDRMRPPVPPAPPVQPVPPVIKPTI